MSYTPEAIALLCLLRTIWLITVPKHLFVPYDKRNRAVVSDSGGEDVEAKGDRGNVNG